MRCRTLGALTLVVQLLLTAPAAALCAAPWQRLGDLGGEITEPVPLVLLGTAVIPPLALASAEGDHELRVLSQTDLGGSYQPERVSVVAPYVVAGGTVVAWGVAALADDCDLQKAPTAMIQGIATTLGVVTVTKWATGRTWPNGGRDPSAADRLEHPHDASEFEPFGYGIDAAFPSGHTAVMFAAAAALRASSPELGLMRFVGYPFAVGVGALMWWGDHHWASDVMSGALVGEALGGSAGRTWAPSDDVEVAFVPMQGGVQLRLSGSLSE